MNEATLKRITDLRMVALLSIAAASVSVGAVADDAKALTTGLTTTTD